VAPKPTEAPPLIGLTGIDRVYKVGGEELYALRGVNLQLKRGEFVAVVGPSGSGKSTLANIIGGLDKPDAGQAVVDGINLGTVSDRKLSAYRNNYVGFVFQAFNLQPRHTALEQVMLPLKLGRVRRKQRRARALQCLVDVGLEDRQKHFPNQLSGGQRQRVSIARALANQPQLVIADEPTGNLDSHKGVEIMDLLRKLNREQAITLIVITHDIDVARQADRVLEIHDGAVTERYS
jgi:putative ABC transport system ATP-binding protein